jgi:mRNA interferase HigB
MFLVWIITEKRLKEAMEQHAHARAPLTDWIIRIRAARPAHFHELRTVFGSVDAGHGFTIFDIGGNNFRLITDVDYATGRVYIKAFLTHAEYNVWNAQMHSSKRRS